MAFPGLKSSQREAARVEYDRAKARLEEVLRMPEVFVERMKALPGRVRARLELSAAHTLAEARRRTTMDDGVGGEEVLFAGCVMECRAMEFFDKAQGQPWKA
jgi:hypothetical protein